mmetsp:Transcript_16025/g.34660  ORF Transcript_16025/g.34660 Transcript_16025/m.34660 type:complete len:117 (+) Transcript_16025:102-452(+)
MALLLRSSLLRTGVQRPVVSIAVRSFANAPQLSDEQLAELSKFDAGLAIKAKQARDAGVAVEWRDLDSQSHPQYWHPKYAQQHMEQVKRATEGRTGGSLFKKFKDTITGFIPKGGK